MPKYGHNFFVICINFETRHVIITQNVGNSGNRGMFEVAKMSKTGVIKYSFLKNLVDH